MQVITGYFEKENSKAVGIFNLKSNVGQVPVELSDGEYVNKINNKVVVVKDNKIQLQQEPIIIFN